MPVKKANATTKTKIVEPTIQPTQPIQPAEMLKPDIIKQVGDLPALISKFKVLVTDEDLREVARIDGLASDMIKTIQGELKPLKDAANKAHKAITKYEGEKLAPLIDLRAECSKLVSTCLNARKLIADEEARKQTVADAQKAREEAEKDREARIEVLALEGKDEELAELLDTELVVENTQAVKVASVVPTGLGMHSVSRWIGEVHNLKLLVEAVASGKLPLGTVENPGPIMVNQAYLNKVAQLEKATMMYPGVTAKDVGGTSR